MTNTSYHQILENYTGTILTGNLSIIYSKAGHCFLKISLTHTTWEKDSKVLQAIRQKVFIEEQKVPESLEWDEEDKHSDHFIAFSNQNPIACARLTPAAQIGRMAVLKEYRNQGAGTLLLKYILDYISNKGVNNPFLHAQTSAVDFYSKQGFNIEGNVFYEADIEHIRMSLTSAENDMTDEFTMDDFEEVFFVDTPLEHKDVATALICSARNTINIITHDFDPPVFDNNEIENCLIKFAKEHKNSRCRILIHDSNKAIQRGHRIIRLAQNLTSTLEIKKPSKEFEHEQQAFITVDNYGFLHRSIASQYNYRASAGYKEPQKVKELNEYFEKIWEQSVPDPQVRRLYV